MLSIGWPHLDYKLWASSHHPLAISQPRAGAQWKPRVPPCLVPWFSLLGNRDMCRDSVPDSILSMASGPCKTATLPQSFSVMKAEDKVLIRSIMEKAQGLSGWIVLVRHFAYLPPEASVFDETLPDCEWMHLDFSAFAQLPKFLLWQMLCGSGWQPFPWCSAFYEPESEQA